MSKNVKNDNHKETPTEIYENMDENTRGLFDAAIQTAFNTGRDVGSMNQTAAFLSLTLTEAQSELLINMRHKAFVKGKEIGELEAQGKSLEEISKQVRVPLKKLEKQMSKKEETDGGSKDE